MLVPSAANFEKKKPGRPIRLAVLGSTGSIGTSALEVVRAHREHFQITALCAGKNIELLTAQAREFNPAIVACGNAEGAKALTAALGKNIRVVHGEAGMLEAARDPEVDTVLAAIVGVAGLRPVEAALRAGKKVALANKEALVSGGEFVAAAVRSKGGSIIPVDSEHSALFQALQGQARDDVAALVLTASGGPFYSTQEDLSKITPEQAVRHPRWNMGAKISIDSATLMNKALEVIEAHWLFGVPESNIEVIIHPQSIVHSLVRFVDGAELAQLSKPDMKGPISYALFYPFGRYPKVMQTLDLTQIGTLEFRPLDTARFPAVGLARQAIRSGGGASAVLNLGNELAVARFMRGALKFTEIVPFAEAALNRFGARAPRSFEDLLALLEEVRAGEEELAVKFSGRAI